MFRCLLKRKINKLTWDNCEKFIPDFEYGKVIKVYDGDTITLGTILQGKPYRFSIRLEGIDAPELRTKNEIEKKAGYLVKSKLEELILNQMVKIENNNKINICLFYIFTFILRDISQYKK